MQMLTGMIEINHFHPNGRRDLRMASQGVSPIPDPVRAIRDELAVNTVELRRDGRLDVGHGGPRSRCVRHGELVNALVTAEFHHDIRARLRCDVHDPRRGKESPQLFDRRPMRCKIGIDGPAREQILAAARQANDPRPRLIRLVTRL